MAPSAPATSGVAAPRRARLLGTGDQGATADWAILATSKNANPVIIKMSSIGLRNKTGNTTGHSTPIDGRERGPIY